MATRIKLRRDTAANWLESNPILAQGETGFETDSRAMKLGDGATRWKDLKYAVTGNLKVTDNTIHGDDVVSVSSGQGDRSNWVLTVNANTGNTSANSTPTSAFTMSVAYDSEGNIFSTGSYFDGDYFGGDQTGMYLIKTDANGEVLFNNYYNEREAFGYSMIVDGNDDVIFVMAETDAESTDTVLVKVSGVDGTFRWQKYLADTDPTSDDVSICVDVDPQNNVIIAGTTATGSQIDFWVGKFNGVTGAPIWQRQYDSDGCEDAASGIAIDSQGNIGVVGYSYGPGTFLGLFKLNGANGDVIWQKRVINASIQAEESYGWGNAWVNGDVFSSDICVDSNNDFYFNLTGIYCSPAAMIAGIHKIKSNGDWQWSKVISYSGYISGSSAVICDSDNNVYLTSTLFTNRQVNPNNNTSQFNTVITKFNASGRKRWSKNLAHEQGGTTSGAFFFGPTEALGQTVAVNDDYILVGGMYFQAYPYDNDSNPSGYLQPYLAQLDKTGTDFAKDGWTFKDNTFKIFDMTAALDDDGYLEDLTNNVADIEVTTGDVTFAENTDTHSLAYINTARVKTMTLDGARLHLPENGGLALSRKQIGHITSIGKFDLDGNEGNNTKGDTWINGITSDADGNIYAAGGWYTYDNWNDGDDYVEVPLVWKIDSEGAIVWTAGNNLDQWGADMVSVAHNAATNTVIALGHDNDDNLENFDGAEGFNLFTLDAGSGTLKSVLHVQTSVSQPSGSINSGADMIPLALALKSDGSPVVVGYINNTYDKFANVTANIGGLPGSSTGVLVINKAVFDRAGNTTDIEYPTGNGYWYINNAAIQYVNKYANVAPTVTSTVGSGAKFEIVITSGWSIEVTMTPSFAGTNYKVGNYINVLGTLISGSDVLNDLTIKVLTVDINGGILTAVADTWDPTGYSAWGIYNAIDGVTLVGASSRFNVIANPTTRAYTISRTNGGINYAIGDTLQVLGSLLGGVDSVNDIIITVTGVTGQGVIDTITSTGLGQAVTIKLDVSTGTDFTQAGSYDIWHYTNGDGFIWTPDWHVSVGGEDNYDTIDSVTVDMDDNIIVGGYSDNLNLGSETTDWGGYAQKAFIAKYNSAGVRQWAKAVDGHEGDGSVWGLTIDADNNVYGVMTTNYYSSGQDPHVIKLDSNGNFVWMTQLNYNNNYFDTISIAMNDDENIIVSTSYESEDTSSDRVGYNNNIQIAKFDKDGNHLFQRLLWSNNGMHTGYNDWYGNNLTVAGDKFVWGGYASAWNDDDDSIAVVAQLPLDGTGLGNHGNYYYEEVEIYVNRWTENDTFGGNVLIVRDVADRLSSREHVLIANPYGTGQETGSGAGDYFGGASGPLTIYADLEAKVAHVREEGGADITGVKEIVFEDGTRQSTSSQDIPQVDISITNRGDDDYYLRYEDRGKHIMMDGGEGVDIVIPNYEQVPFPVGTNIVIVTDYDSQSVYSEGNDDYMINAGADGAGSYAWIIPRYSMANLLKIRQGYNSDGTPQNSGTWMISGPGLTTP